MHDQLKVQRKLEVQVVMQQKDVRDRSTEATGAYYTPEKSDKEVVAPF